MQVLTRIKDEIIDLIAAIILWFVMMWDDVFDVIKTVVITYVSCLICVTFFFMPVQVDGTSMYPTIMDETLGFSSVITKKISGIKRFDIVTIRIEGEEKKLIKRVIGLPNDTIMVKDEILYINNEKVDETYLNADYVQEIIAINGEFTRDFIYVLGEDEYFCLGDNRYVSADSRYYGTFKSKQIISVGLFVFYPFDRIGSVN